LACCSQKVIATNVPRLNPDKTTGRKYIADIINAGFGKRVILPPFDIKSDEVRLLTFERANSLKAAIMLKRMNDSMEINHVETKTSNIVLLLLSCGKRMGYGITVENSGGTP
jgi:hypothetical protein